MTTVTQAKPQGFKEIQIFYDRCGYGGGLNQEDSIFIARLEGKIVGAVRLCPNTGFCVLRGMRVIDPFQRQGIGTRLLQECTALLVDRVCYCIPWQHLLAFYERSGFAEIAPAQAPELLRDRWKNYVDRGLNVILMRRLPPS
ncbi:MAG: GNAT family N-acetyltransferase [Cyanosarcina radialis HA8281-LM2]|jgi:N-acetylglutamate synthase-like GNAT family acetyltransferase|nr:GNAT family N-acetyltransferase [Cyanosarcina radialis HA8281-LM2]